MATPDKQTCLTTKFVRICQCAVAFHYQVPKLCTDLDPTLVYILISGTYVNLKLARNNKMLVLGVDFPQTCSSAGLVFGAPKSLSAHFYITTDELFRFHINEINEMPGKPNSTENPCSFEKYPTTP